MDSRLEAAAAAAGINVRDVTLTRLLHWSMAADPDRLHMINGLSGEHVTNAEMLRNVVSVCRELTSRDLKGRVLLVLMRNHQHLMALYYAALFAGAVPLLLEPLSTTRELIHFLRVSSPSLVFCDTDRRDDVTAALDEYAGGAGAGGALTHQHVITHDELIRIAATHVDNTDKFEPVNVDPESVALLLPTSGSTGLAKAAEIQHSALMAHLPTLWVYHERFPTPTDRVMFMSTAQWMTFSNLVTACPVYGIPVIISPDKTIPTILRIMETHKPTWILLVPGTAAHISEVGERAQFTSLQTLVTTGAALPAGALPRLRHLMMPHADILNSYGMTEAQGFVAIAHRTEPDGAIGKINNIYDYKLVDEDGREVARGEKGELYIKSACVIKAYRNNPDAYSEGATEDGWWRTGDLMVEDDNIPGCMHFVERKKFWFKYLNHQISPEELEGVVSSVHGVRDVVVTDSPRGAAAAVVLGPGVCADTVRDDIHALLNRELPEYKQLRGGIAFVTSLPRTHSGKLHRAECTRYVTQLIKNGECK